MFVFEIFVHAFCMQLCVIRLDHFCLLDETLFIIWNSICLLYEMDFMFPGLNNVNFMFVR